MADEPKPPDGGTGNADAGTAELEKQIAELKAALAGKDGQISDLEAIKAQLVDARNALKKKEDEALAEQGKYKDLYEKTLAELESIKNESSTTKTELQAAQARLKEIEEAERTRLLALLPDGKREEFKDFDVPSLQKVVALAQIDDRGGASNASPAKPPVNGAPPDFSKMTEAEQMKYGVEHGMSPAQIVLARQRARQRNM